MLNIMTVGIAAASFLAVTSSIWPDRLSPYFGSQLYREIELASENYQPGEPARVTELRVWQDQNLDKLLAEEGSEHPKGVQPGTGEIRADLKTGATVDDLAAIEIDRTSKGGLLQ